MIVVGLLVRGPRFQIPTVRSLQYKEIQRTAFQMGSYKEKYAQYSFLHLQRNKVILTCPQSNENSHICISDGNFGKFVLYS